MKTRNLVTTVGIIAALAAPAGQALACGGVGMAMAMPMAAPMAGAVAGPVVGMALPQIGLEVAALPAGFVTVVVNGATFFRAGPTWYQPFQAPSGPMYRVVPAPHGM